MQKPITLSGSTCENCQPNKCRHEKYRHLPEEEAETMPWDKMCINLIEPYTIHITGNKKPLVCKCVMMIDPATGGWFKIYQYKDNQSITVSNIAEQ
jgi:hypothetical protein